MQAVTIVLRKQENMLVICLNKAKLDFNDTEHAPANYTPANQQTHQFTEWHYFL